MATKITRSQALCLIFCMEDNEQNRQALIQRLNDMKDIEICYEKDPRRPVLIPRQWMFAHALDYHQYMIDQPTQATETEVQHLDSPEHNEENLLGKSAWFIC